MNFAGSGSQKGFQVQAPAFRMRSGGGFGAAADMTDTSGIFQANRARAPKYDQQSATDMATRAQDVMPSQRQKLRLTHRVFSQSLKCDLQR